MRKFRASIATLMAIVTFLCITTTNAESIKSGEAINHLKLYEAQQFSSGSALVSVAESNRTGRYVINTAGVVTGVIPDDMVVLTVFVNGLAYAKLNDQRVLINTEGQVVISPEIQGFEGVLGFRLPNLRNNQVPSDFSDVPYYGERQHEIQDRRKANPAGSFSTLAAGYVLVYDKAVSFQGDTYQLGVLDVQGNWLMPLNDACGTQDEIRAFLDGLYSPLMWEGKIVAWGSLSYALDVAAQSISKVEPPKGFNDGVTDWQYYEQSGMKTSLRYLRADGSTALELNTLFPTLIGGRDFVGDYAAVLFDSGSSYFVGVIDKNGALVAQPVPARTEGYGVLNEQLFYVQDTSSENTVVYGFDGTVRFTLQGRAQIWPLVHGLALVTTKDDCYYVNASGQRVIGLAPM